tara:strand:- start:834 stop:1184 length:351 start_codon:yes stop_codon:yes gene_type:complete
MGATSVISIILFQLCTQAMPLDVGMTAPCAGILWTIPQTKNALKCSQVEVPTLTAKLNLCASTKAIEIRKLETKLRTANNIIETTPEAPPPWILPAVAVGTFFAGALSVVLLAGAM